MAAEYQSLRNEKPVAHHAGVFQKELTLFQGTALIMSGTIGAGVLGIPYVVAQVGLGIGLAYILFMGLLMMSLNLLIADVVLATRERLQIVGLAKKYLGKVGGSLVTLLSYSLLLGVLMVYIIGEGETLAALFGGSPFWWSVGFFVFASSVVAVGLRTVKTIELFLSLGLLTVVFLFIALSSPHITWSHWTYSNFANLFVPYGVLLFAFHGSTAIPEAHSLLGNKTKTFKRAIVTANIMCMLIYAMFAAIVVGVTGPNTTEIATIGLGQAIGNSVFVLGNVFAAFAMATGFLMAGLGLRDSLRWDFRVPTALATLLVCGIPFLVFLSGVRTFIQAIGIVGGVFMSLELLAILLIYHEAKKRGEVEHGHMSRTGALHATAPVLVLLLMAFSLGAIFSIYHLL